MERFKIDDVAKATGLTKRTIRYYEEIGLIKPPARSEGGTRLYTAEDIERLKNIVAAREVLGFSLQAGAAAFFGAERNDGDASGGISTCGCWERKTA